MQLAVINLIVPKEESSLKGENPRNTIHFIYNERGQFYGSQDSHNIEFHKHAFDSQ